MPMKAKKENKLKILVEQMPDETQEQYAAFLAYCSMINRSIREVSKRWAEIGRELGEQNSKYRLGKQPSAKTLFKWSKKYSWVRRVQIWDEEKKKLMTLEFQRTESQRSVKVSRLFEKISTHLLQQVNRDRAITVDEFKKAWEMFRTESGLSTGNTEIRHTINEDEQTPPTPQDEEFGKKLDELEKQHYDE
ncbi:MAG: hypothetical protein UT45_C0001G0061 [Candidatus Daviesbacteria bacterium GW2011_GWA2_39_33]|nr:MAG: hypothetical protein UT04_C0071G0007 [Candidatus Daviesbacteria bacterium GW2011_GWF2_38_7]KKR17386.1 MAG: hypothetical protein UT45_C0001G0061 [Candidatus Daviesbacteria bacterium GW2011_GWA2_39_33]